MQTDLSTLASTLALAGAITALSACGSGAMGQVQTSSADAADKGSLGSALDAPLAVGGEARPAFVLHVKGSTAPPTHLIAIRRDIVDVRDGLVVGKAPGVAAVLIALDNDSVVDFMHVWVRSTDRLAVHGIDAGGSDLGPLSEPIELVVGDAMRLVPHPYAGSERLVGVGMSVWTVDPPIAVVLREGLPNRVRLVARKPGDATVKVSMLGAISTLKLKVVP